MKDFHMIAGLPRSGSTLLCQLLNMNPDFKATQTSPIIEMLTSQQSVFSHSGSFKAVDRLDYYGNFVKAQNAFIDAYYEGDKIIFDKNRSWTAHFMKMDEILGHKNSKVIWTYRAIEQCITSMERQHRKYPIIQFSEEAQNNLSMNSLESRINAWTSDGGIISRPILNLHDAVELGYGDRIHIVHYDRLCADTQNTLNEIHDFLGFEYYNYNSKNFKNLKQSTVEHDNLYNYKYPHQIKEGKIAHSASKSLVPKRLKEAIANKYKWLTDYINNG